MAEVEQGKKVNLELTIETQVFFDIIAEDVIGTLVKETYSMDTGEIAGTITIDRIYNKEGKLLDSFTAKNREDWTMKEQSYIAKFFCLKNPIRLSRKSEHYFY